MESFDLTTRQNLLNSIRGLGTSWLDRLFKLYAAFKDYVGDTSDKALNFLASIASFQSAIPVNLFNSTESIQSVSSSDELWPILQNLKSILFDLWDSALQFGEDAPGVQSDYFFYQVNDSVPAKIMSIMGPDSSFSVIGHAVTSGLDQFINCCITGKDGIKHTIYCHVLGDSSLVFYVNELGVKLKDLVSAFNVSSFGNLLLPNVKLEQVIQGKGMAIDYLNILQRSLSLPWASNFNEAKNSFNYIVSNSACLSSDAKQDILQAVISGPDGLCNYFSSLFSQLKKSMESADSEGFFNSTSIVVNEFSWGVVMSAVLGIGQMIASVITMVNQVIGVIVSIVASIGYYITKMINNIIEQRAGVKFKIHTDGDSGFSFVVGQWSVQDPELAEAILSTTCTGCTLHYKTDPSVFLLYVVDVETSQVLIEEHISCDFSLVGALRKRTVAGTTILCDENDVIRVGKVKTSNPQITSQVNRFLLRTTFNSVFVENLCTQSYSPVSFNFWDRVSSLFSDSNLVEGELAIRLASGLYLWCLRQMVDSYTNTIMDYETENPGWLPSGRNYFTWRNYNIAGPGTNSGAWALIRSLAGSCENLLIEAMNHGRNGEGFYYDAGGGTLDDVLVNIKNTFNALAYMNHATLADRAASGVDVYSEVGSNSASHSFVVQTTSAITPIAHLDSAAFYNLWTAFDDLQDYVVECKHLYVLNWSNFTANFDGSFQLDIPSATFTGYIAGLIIDGLIVVTAAAIAVGAVIGYFRIKNKRARLQAEAEAQWYNYQDALSSGSSADADLAWHAYKSTRLKYNVLALFTGGTTLGLGLYDDGSSLGSGFLGLTDQMNQTKDKVDVDTTVVNDNVTGCRNDLSIHDGHLTDVGSAIHSVIVGENSSSSD